MSGNRGNTVVTMATAFTSGSSYVVVVSFTEGSDNDGGDSVQASPGTTNTFNAEGLSVANPVSDFVCSYIAIGV
jgi:hypothetical protein